MFDPFNLPRQFDIRDIAHALSHLCRFGGHTREFYSVAQHSVLVSYRAEQLDPEAGLWGLLHDASEAFLGDVVRPLKSRGTFDEYRLIEAAVQAAIFGHFGCRGVAPAAVAVADDDVLAIEFRDLMPRRPGDEWERLAGAAPRVRPASSEAARSMFLCRFAQLTTRRGL